jgi:hypothetical protein
VSKRHRFRYRLLFVLVALMLLVMLYQVHVCSAQSCQRVRVYYYVNGQRVIDWIWLCPVAVQPRTFRSSRLR